MDIFVTPYVNHEKYCKSIFLCNGFSKVKKVYMYTSWLQSMLYTFIKQALSKKKHLTAVTVPNNTHMHGDVKNQKISNLKNSLNLVLCLFEWILLQCCISIFKVVSLQREFHSKLAVAHCPNTDSFIPLFTYIPGRLSHSIHRETFEVEFSEVRHSDIHLRTHHIQTNVNIGHLHKNKLQQNTQCL